jgi:hypothetical protein
MQNRNMGRKRKQGNITPQKMNNKVIEDLVENEGDEFPVAVLRRMMVRIFNELRKDLKKNMKKNTTTIKRTWIKLKKTQK